MPDSTDELLTAANAAHASGKLQEAEVHVRQVLKTDSQNVQANLLMGVLAGKTGRNQVALKHLDIVVAANQESFEALFWLSMLHRRQGELQTALDFARRAMKLRPNDAHSHNNLGMCLLSLVRLEAAIEAFSHALKLLPNQAPVLHNLGTALYLVGRDMDAAKAFDQALLLSPRSVDSYLSLGQVLLSQTNPGEAIKCAQRALQIDPKSAEGELLLASALVEDSRTGEAEPHLKRAIELNPQESQAHGLLGQRFQSLGKFAEANEHLAKAMELEPRQGFAYFAYVYNNKVTEKDLPMLEKMEALLAEGGLDPRQTNFLHYGLGRAYETLGDYEKAMKSFDEANRVARKLKFGDQPFDERAYARRFEQLIETFSREFLETNRRASPTSNLPIIIVGMMRSGTTLAEQILSSHPQIGAAGEQKFWPHASHLIRGKHGDAFGPNRLAELGTQYLDLLAKIAPGSPHVSDKNPGNYEHLGLIHVALPNARIIHMRRNPVDTCISIYTTPNRVKVEFAYDRESIVFAYQQYLRLMDHWRAVLPADRFIEVNYEDVVADREAQARRMLALIGIEWDEALLHHERNQRNVLTPSLWQVRQPIYTSSMERWRRYEPWLGAFRKLL